mmetsp:Transcript_12666/g.29754  ORF Transcript_12666/g.29754 Transcript_12666/m.29754 type:complete len:216 (+) Transcript_12666:699-1346(+)
MPLVVADAVFLHSLHDLLALLRSLRLVHSPAHCSRHTWCRNSRPGGSSCCCCCCARGCSCRRRRGCRRRCSRGCLSRGRRFSAQASLRKGSQPRLSLLAQLLTRCNNALAAGRSNGCICVGLAPKHLATFWEDVLSVSASHGTTLIAPAAHSDANIGHGDISHVWHAWHGKRRRPPSSSAWHAEVVAAIVVVLVGIILLLIFLILILVIVIVAWW